MKPKLVCMRYIGDEKMNYEKIQFEREMHLIPHSGPTKSGNEKH
jgi:hypothetical protein